MKQYLIYILMIIVFLINSCDKEPGNILTVNVFNNGTPAEKVNIFVRDLFPLDDNMEGIEALTNASGQAIFKDLREDVYEIWITFPGYEEIRQRLPIKNNDDITINTSLVKKALPEGFKSIKVIGNFNNWNLLDPLELNKNDKGIWQSSDDFANEDTVIYMLYFDQPYFRFYNPDSDSLKYYGGQQPSYQSIDYRKNDKLLITFDENRYDKSEVPFLNHWVDREIVGTDAESFITFEKLMTNNYQQLSEVLFKVNKLSENVDPTSEVDSRELIGKLDELYNEPGIKSILTEIETFSENSAGELFDLSKIELAKINLVMGQNGKAKHLAEDVDLNSFAGSEAFNIVAMNFMKLPAGFAEYSRKKLEEITNPKTRYAIINKMVPAYYFLGDVENLRKSIDIVLEEFPDTKLAERCRKILHEMDKAE